MADIVASSVVQEGVSWVSSYFSDKLEEKASHGHSKARLEMALSRVKFALERTGEWPITYVALLHRRMMLKQGYMEGTGLLHKLKLQSSEGREEIGQWATSSSFFQWISRARSLPILSLISLSKENISSSIVQKFEWLADCADKFVTDVESGCPLRDETLLIRYPLERQLLEGKTLQFGMLKGSQSQYMYMWPVCSEGRGIEVQLRYCYEDLKMPANRFDLILYLRLSQGTSIVGTAIRCLQFLTEALVVPTFRFKCMTESVIGEITLISSLQDFTHSYGAPPKACYHFKKIKNKNAGDDMESFVQATRYFRQDPICCTNNVVSSELSQGVPEPVIGIFFRCYISAPECMLNNSADEVVGANAPFLKLLFLCVPHVSITRQQGTRIVVKFEGKRRRVNGSTSMQLMGELLRSRAFDCLDRSPEAAGYIVFWHSPHGAAYINLEKPRPEMQCLQPTAVPRPGRRAAKRKR